MEESKTNVKSLNPLTAETRDGLMKKLKDTHEILELQAQVAEARMRIKKANLEELIYALKQHELEQKPNDGNSQKS